MLVDPESLNILYTYQKTAEFATSLENGPFADTNLGMLLRSVRRSMDRGDYKFADFEHYRPNLGRPSAFLASPIFDDTKMIGILVVQFPVDEINRVMTGGYRWETEGLGNTGEVFLVGPDFRMRSRSRFMHEDEKNLIATLERLGVPSRTMKHIQNMHTLVLNLENRTPNVEAAVGGETGIALTTNYRGVPVISSYAPLEVEGLRWGIIAEMDQGEAFAPIRDYERKVLAYSVGIILLVALLASILARFFVSPIHKLAKGARRIASGENDVIVKVKSRDEFRDLADSFNEMSRSLKAKGETIEKQMKENEELLLNILPGPVAAKMRHGEESLTESFADVTVLFAEVTGYTELSEGMSADQSVSLLNDLIIAFDEAAERHGVEKVKTTGTSYMAVCGLSVSRPDHVNRVIEFAQDILRIVRRFNQERDTNLSLEIGVNTGPVVGGVVGRSKFIYDLWGDTVNVARGLRAVGRVNVIEVTQAVHDRLKDLYDFESSSTVHVRGKGELATWSIKP